MTRLFKDARNGDYWRESDRSEEVEKCPEGSIPVYPYGGGFLHFIPESELIESELPTGIVEGWATFDDDPNVYKCLYNPHDRWNGWHQPVFSKQAFDKIVEDWGGTLVKDDIFSNDTEEHEYWRLLAEDDKLEDDDGIYVTRTKKNDMWYMDGVCWICMTDEELSMSAERWDIIHVKKQ